MKNQDVLIHFMHENGAGFIEIAKELGISAIAAAQSWVKVDSAKEAFNKKEKVVYRKRLSNINVKSRQQKLATHMRLLCTK